MYQVRWCQILPRHHAVQSSLKSIAPEFMCTVDFFPPKQNNRSSLSDFSTLIALLGDAVLLTVFCS